MCFNDNRRFRKRGNNCFECGKPGHFAVDCPNKNKGKGEFDYGKHKNDYGRHKNKDKHKKKGGGRDYHKKRNKARALASLSDINSESSTSSESSSSDEEDVGKRKKDGKNFNGLCFYTKSHPNYCVMAIDADGETSDPEPDSEVNELPPTREQLVEELEDLKDCLYNQDRVLKKAAKERKQLKAELETALHDLESLRSASVSSAASDDLPECAECEVHMTSLVSLKSKYADLVDELDASRAALDEIKSRPVLLKACESCSVLRKKLDDACARIALLEKSPASSSKTDKPACEICPALYQEVDDFKYALTNSENENWNLRAILGWISAREPQLGMIISKFKKGDGFGIGLSYNRVYDDYGKIGECSGVSQSEKPPPSSPESSETKPTQNLDGVVDGVFQEPTREPPKKQVWVEKPNHLRNPLDTLPPAANRRPAPHPKAKPQPPPRKPPQPLRQAVRFHCDYCHKEGHLEGFCFRRKRNKDMYQGVHEPLPRGRVRQPAQPRRVREPARRAPGRDPYDSGQLGLGFESRRGAPRFAHRGDRRPPRRQSGGGVMDAANPTVEQMARHWFSTHFPNPSVEAFVHRSFRR